MSAMGAMSSTSLIEVDFAHLAELANTLCIARDSALVSHPFDEPKI